MRRGGRGWICREQIRARYWDRAVLIQLHGRATAPRRTEQCRDKNAKLPRRCLRGDCRSPNVFTYDRPL